MDQVRDELLDSDVNGNPLFKDIKVREASTSHLYRADQDPRYAWSFDAFGADDRAGAVQAVRWVSPPEFRSRRREEASDRCRDPDAFEVTMICPNDRYVNDAAICQAVVGTLARIGVKVSLLAQPKAQYSAKVLKPVTTRPHSICLAGRPARLDSDNVLHDIMGCRDDPKSNCGEANLGGYCNRSSMNSPRRSCRNPTRPSATS